MTQAQALTILKTGANVFLTGEPGSGKTHTVNVYVQYLRDHGIEPAITASTGIAATHIHGATIHSWSGIGVRRELGAYDIDRIAGTEYIARRIMRTHVLIIDEVSMIDALTLDVVDRICREVKHRDEAFGGIQVVLVGDFFQLPPVSAAEARFAFESRVWKAMRPVICYLTEQYRQSDRRFLDILQAIRRDRFDEEHHSYLQDRVQDSTESTVHDLSITRLFAHNVNVDELNDRELAKLRGVPMTYDMRSKGSESLVATLKKGCLSPEVLTLKIGATVMCTKNNTQKGYMNGTLGIVVGFESGSRNPIIETKRGERITIEPMDWTVEEGGKIRASITQVPLRLAWAITIHKSQGMSLDAAVMDLSGVFEYGQGYVALSRVRTLSGLHLLGANPKAFKIHPHILAQDETFVNASHYAEAAFADISPADLMTMHHNFLLASGGHLDTKRHTRSRKRVSKTKSR